MIIPMVDLKEQYYLLKDEIDKGLTAGLEQTQFILGPNVRAFEEECAKYLGVAHAVGVASGTDALHLALIAAGVEEGDEVITTSFTFIATAEAIRYVGATPVFVDIDPKPITWISNRWRRQSPKGHGQYYPSTFLDNLLT
jgi:dTDP-4-amino-4,6-dideoxygalactose transaminase